MGLAMLPPGPRATLRADIYPLGKRLYYMEFKRSLVSAVLVGAAAFSGSAFAGATGNVGAFSEYMFRGVEQSNGAAVQGGLDYVHDSGLYVGTWISNTDWAGYQAQVKYETDVYGGYTFKAGDFTFDVGALFYYYRNDTRSNTIEYYAGVSAYNAALKVYYTDDYFGTDDEGTYITANYAIALSDSLTLTPQVGYSIGDGPKNFVVSLFDTSPSDHYLDYSLTLAKTLDNGLTFTLGLIGSDLKDQDEKIVVGLKKTFDL
jgi:uncharacterized protein (TIGR02001 family)